MEGGLEEVYDEGEGELKGGGVGPGNQGPRGAGRRNVHGEMMTFPDLRLLPTEI